MMAVAVGVASAQRSTQAAERFNSPPSNQVVHSAPRLRSATFVYGVEKGMPRNFTTVSQNQAASATDRAYRSWEVEMSWRRMNCDVRAAAARSGLGVHTICSGIGVFLHLPVGQRVSGWQ